MLLADKLPAASNPPEAETLKIDLKGAVSTAIQNNRDIRISEYALTEAEASVSEVAAAKTRVWPIHFSAGRSKSGSGTSGRVASIQESFWERVKCDLAAVDRRTGGRAD